MGARIISIIFILLLLIPFTILTADKNNNNEKLFQEFDKNNDAVISIEEASRNNLLFRQFNKIDINKNKKLERSEFAAFEPEERFQPPDMGEHEPGAGPLD